jgi:hypothetical protein
MYSKLCWKGLGFRALGCYDISAPIDWNKFSSSLSVWLEYTAIPVSDPQTESITPRERNQELRTFTHSHYYIYLGQKQGRV